MAVNEGVLVSAPIRPLSTDDTYPTAIANEIKGGCHNKRNREEIETITRERIEEGMLVTIPNNIYQRIEKSAHWVNLVTNYIHIQDEPLSIWNITHNLKRYPDLTIIDSTGRIVECDIRYISIDVVEVHSNIPFKGIAQLR